MSTTKQPTTGAINSEGAEGGRMSKNFLTATGALLWILISAQLGAMVAAQTTATNEPVVLSLARHSRACYGKSIKLTAKLKNKSDKAVIIDTKGLWHSIDVQVSRAETRRDDTGNEIVGGEDVGSKTMIAPHYQRVPNYVILKPGQSYEGEFDLSLDDAIYKAGNRVRLQTSYAQFSDNTVQGKKAFVGVVDSNEIEFHVSSCRR